MTKKTPDPKQFNDIVYVCPVSEYILPIYEACMVRKPACLVLIVSDFTQAQDAAQRLAALLSESLPGIEILRPDQDAPKVSLKGDDPLEMQAWIKQVLKPCLDRVQRPQTLPWLNITNGTKAMIMALTTGLIWKVIDYRANDGAYLRSYGLSPDAFGTHNGLSGAQVDAELPGVSPLEVARLYNPEVREAGPNPLRRIEQSLPLARRLFEALAHREPALRALFEMFESVWVAGREDPDCKFPQVTLEWNHWLSEQQVGAWATFNTWVERLQELCPTALTLEGSRLTFPGNGRLAKRDQHFKQWISGDWLEQLVRQWLHEAGLPAEHISGNLVGLRQSGDSATGREADFLIHHQGKTTLVEVKADLPPGKNPGELEQQVSTAAARFGKTKRVLVVGPELYHQMKEEAWQSFQRRCDSSGVILCRRPEELHHVFAVGTGSS